MEYECVVVVSGTEERGQARLRVLYRPRAKEKDVEKKGSCSIPAAEKKETKSTATTSSRQLASSFLVAIECAGTHRPVRICCCPFPSRPAFGASGQRTHHIGSFNEWRRREEGEDKEEYARHARNSKRGRGTTARPSACLYAGMHESPPRQRKKVVHCRQRPFRVCEQL